MTEELIERITTKLFFIEQDAALIRKWLENGTDKDPEFLAEINATNDAEPQAEYGVTMLVEASPSIPDLEGIKPLGGIENHVEEVIQRFGLEQESKPQQEEKSAIQVLFEQQDKPEWAVIAHTDDLYVNFCTWIIKGENDTANPVTDARLFFMQEQKKVRFTKKDFDHIQNLMWWRSELIKGKNGDFSLKDILTQNSTFEWEKPLWEALAKTIK